MGHQGFNNQQQMYGGGIMNQRTSNSFVGGMMNNQQSMPNSMMGTAGGNFQSNGIVNKISSGVPQQQQDSYGPMYRGRHAPYPSAAQHTSQKRQQQMNSYGQSVNMPYGAGPVQQQQGGYGTGGMRPAFGGPQQQYNPAMQQQQQPMMGGYVNQQQRGMMNGPSNNLVRPNMNNMGYNNVAPVQQQQQSYGYGSANQPQSYYQSQQVNFYTLFGYFISINRLN